MFFAFSTFLQSIKLVVFDKFFAENIRITEYLCNFALVYQPSYTELAHYEP